MACPNKNNCSLRKTLTSDEFLSQGEKALNMSEYRIVDSTMRILTDKFCNSDDAYKNCKEYIAKNATASKKCEALYFPHKR
jgi:hypothetical protein